MNRPLIAGPLFVLSFAFALAGCTKTANQTASSDAASSPDSSSPSGSAAPKKEAAPRPKPIVVPADTAISVVLDEPVGSKTSTTGQTFAATVQVPVEVEGRLAIPKGARATGIVKDAKPAGRFKGGAVLALELTSVTVGERNYEIQTSAHTVTSTGKGKRTAAMVGGGSWRRRGDWSRRRRR